MPQFSRSSMAKLATCHEDLRDLFEQVVKYFDIKIVEGHRSTAKQKMLYAQGRTRPGNIVTYCDGVQKISRHQTSPSIAVDVVPYPELWSDKNRFYELAGFVKAFALGLAVPVQWGGDWRMKDYPHWELKS